MVHLKFNNKMELTALQKLKSWVLEQKNLSEEELLKTIDGLIKYEESNQIMVAYDNGYENGIDYTEKRIYGDEYYENTFHKELPPYVSDDFTIGYDGAFEYKENENDK